MESERTVHCEDALAWLTVSPVSPGASLVSSLPDISEFPHYSLADWQAWFGRAASLILSRCPDDGVSVFFQSDIRVDGAWVDKGYLCQRAAESMGHALLWHRIACRIPAGTVTSGRPSYSHVLCFSKGLRLADGAAPAADVMPSVGDKTWERGMGLETARMIAKFIAQHTSSHTVVNPFCGEGAVLAAANAAGLKAVGIERSPKRAEKARALSIDESGHSFTRLPRGTRT